MNRELIQQIEQWWQSSQQKSFDRNYSAELISVLRDDIDQNYISSELGRKLYKILTDLKVTRKFTLNYGVNDVFQYHACSETGIQTAYVSGGLCSFSDTPTGEVGADMADYPYITVPEKVSKLVKSALHHARIDRLVAYQENRPVHSIDRLVPIIADADSGHGGLTSIMKLSKLFVEAGAAAIHIDDQVEGTKKFKVKTAGRVLVPVSEHIARLKACKLQFDILGADTLLFHRTDAETAGYLTSTIDARDTPFILGQTSFCEDLVTLAEAVEMQTPDFLNEFLKSAKSLNIANCLRYLKQRNVEIDWDCEIPRSSEGWYRYKGCVESAIVRAVACLPFCDLVWSRTAKTDWHAAEQFALKVQEASPGKLMGFNVFPMKDDNKRNFVQRLADLGYVWQFWPMAGMEAAAIGATDLCETLVEGSMEAFYGKYHQVKSNSMLDKNWQGGLYTDIVTDIISSK